MINVKKIWFEKYRNENSGLWLLIDEETAKKIKPEKITMNYESRNN